MIKRSIIFLIINISIILPAFTQDDDEFWQEFLEEEIEVENPVYLPVVGIGIGMLHFMGDVKNDYNSPLIGQIGYKINIATFIDNKHNLRANFFFVGGKLNGENRSFTDPRLNYNFQTDILNFGVNINYNFKNFYAKPRKVYPFISAGVASMQYNPKGDNSTSYNGEEIAYHYWTDGTIRNIPETEGEKQYGIPISRDYDYETNLRDADLYGKKDKVTAYDANNAINIPIDVGLDFIISPRVFLRLGYSFNYAFNDFIDNLGGEKNLYNGIDDRGGNNLNDMFSLTYATMHLDLFSPPKTFLFERLFADIEVDPTLIGDEDNDMVFDVSDECMGTPYGIEIDSVGCPYDDDKDGVPNYLDHEPNTAPNAFVDEFGVTYNTDQLIAKLDATDAVRRNEVELYILSYLANSRNKYGSVQVPKKFVSVDTDKDGYVSFEEILNTIDKYFDFDSDLSTVDLNELNEFFFSQ